MCWGRLLTDPTEEGGPTSGGTLLPDGADAEEGGCLSWGRPFNDPPEKGGRMIAGMLLADIDDDGDANAEEGGCWSRGTWLVIPAAAEVGCIPRGTVFADPADEGECISGGGGMYRWSQDCLSLRPS